MRRMRRTAIVAVVALLFGCGRAEAPVARLPAPPRPVTPPSTPAPTPAAAPGEADTSTWPQGLAGAMGTRGTPHVQPLSLPPDEAGRERWLTFVGSPSEARGAFIVARGGDGSFAVQPVGQWPTAVRVLGGMTAGKTTYLLLETLQALDQPGGLRGVWMLGSTGASPFDESPLRLADVGDMPGLEARLKHPASLGTGEHNAPLLVATLRAASTSAGALAQALATEGAEVGRVWQATFVQPVGHLDGQGSAPSALTDRALAVVRGALETQACGADTCETWSDAGHATVKFEVQSGRWVIRSILEEAPAASAGAAANTPNGSPRGIDARADTSRTAQLLSSRAREVTQVLGEAPLTASGGTVGVGLTDLAPDVPVVVVEEDTAVRAFLVDAVAARKPWDSAKWDVAFADVDGDGRTDVVLRLEGTRSTVAVSWTQVFLAPAPSVQSRVLKADLASSWSILDAPDVHAAARSAVSLPARGVNRDEACRVMTAATTPAGFRRIAPADARVLRFDQPGMPTWLPKVVPAAKVGPDDVRGLAAHCADLQCSSSRPYCEWSAGTDAQHVWFQWHDSDLAISAVANYVGE